MEVRSSKRFTQRVSGVEEFIRVAELKSFVRAAESMGFSTSGVARAVRLLEARIGVPLLKGSVIFNNSEAMTDAAIQGLGIIQVPHFHTTVAVQNNQLIPILSGWSILGHPIQLVYPQNRHLSSKVRVFVDFFQRLLQDK